MNKKILALASVFIATWTAKWKDSNGCPVMVEISPFTGDVSPSNNMVGVRYCNKTNAMKHEFKTLEEVREFFKQCPEGVCNDIKIEKREILEGEPKL